VKERLTICGMSWMSGFKHWYPSSGRAFSNDH